MAIICGGGRIENRQGVVLGPQKGDGTHKGRPNEPEGDEHPKSGALP